MIFPMGGMSRISWLRICPNAAVTHRSGSRSRKASTPSRRIFSGWNTGIPASCAATFTGLGVSLLPRPFGRSGCVKTPTTLNPSLISALRLGTAKSGVPMKTILTVRHPPVCVPGSPLPSVPGPSRRCTAARPGGPARGTRRGLQSPRFPAPAIYLSGPGSGQ